MQPHRLPSITLSVSPWQSVQRGKLNASAAGAVDHTGPSVQLPASFAQLTSKVTASGVKGSSSRLQDVVDPVETEPGRDEAAGSSRHGGKMDTQSREGFGRAGTSHVQAMISAFDPTRQAWPHIGELTAAAVCAWCAC